MSGLVSSTSFKLPHENTLSIWMLSITSQTFISNEVMSLGTLFWTVPSTFNLICIFTIEERQRLWTIIVMFFHRS